MITYQMVLFFNNFTYAFVHDEFTLVPQQSLLKKSPHKLRRAESDEMSLPDFAILRSSNDARPKMSDQLAVLLLTFK